MAPKKIVDRQTSSRKSEKISAGDAELTSPETGNVDAPPEHTTARAHGDGFRTVEREGNTIR